MSDRWSTSGQPPGPGGPPLAAAPPVGVEGLPAGPPVAGEIRSGAGWGAGPLGSSTTAPVGRGTVPPDPFARGRGGPGDGPGGGLAARDRVLIAVSAVVAVVLVAALVLLTQRNSTDVASGPGSSTTLGTRTTSSTTTPSDPSDPSAPSVPPSSIPGIPGPSAPPSVPPTSPRPPVDAAVIEAEVQDLIPWIEENRGLTFTEAVTVTVVPPEQFDQRLDDEVELERARIEDEAVLLQAFGILPGGSDAVELHKQLLKGSVGGFYDPATDELVVEGVELDQFTRRTIVHELVHALQDQNFEADRPEYDDRKDELVFGFHAVLEGDARRMENIWVLGLTDEEKDELDAEEDAATAAALQTLQGVPESLLAFLGAPYELGEPMAQAALDRGGQLELDALFATPPETSEQVLHDDALIDREPRIDVPKPPAEGKEVTDGAFGELATQVLIAPIVGRTSGEKAATGWGGDWSVSWFQDESTPCGRIDWQMDTANDLDELETILKRWAERMPQATIERPKPDVVRATSCMPSSASGGESPL